MNVQTPTISEKLAVDPVSAVALADFKPFAQLTIGPNIYEISSSEGMEQIAFADMGSSNRVQLRRNLNDGWAKIGSEIIMRTKNALHEYISMHVLKMKGETLGEGPLFYNLFDMTWIVRVNASDTGVEMKFPDQPWVNVDLNRAEFENQCQEIVLHALIKARPDLHDMLFDDIDQWGQRMSAGVQVLPIM